MAREATTSLKQQPACDYFNGWQLPLSGGSIELGWMLFGARVFSLSACFAHAKFSKKKFNFNFRT
jgi:hypothetical protein